MVRPHYPIECSPEILSGIPVFADTRVPVKALIDYLEGGDSVAEFLDDFPTVGAEQARTIMEHFA